ncbi:LuxR family transcriptional regulator [Lacihabitans sp. LS3-19]|uniref:LuxR C-terminal-related transcriptional regulator n=1 Tax=Lacihabitans sp. LS3-19 TaxID=2487335 RepID=UPI0020CC69DE|nr:LuxR C-terminal-related transcriptional regulator [Lacihabitans sp. LS3-19]MCP9768435.1 LuxR family transcriptional regulator [Lacihabitans sp. LS3-19]
MEGSNNIAEVFFKYLLTFGYEEDTLDYQKVEKHTKSLQVLSEIGNSGTGIFDLNKREFIFYSSNFGGLLGYNLSDYAEKGQEFFAQKIHAEDILKCSLNGISFLKILNNIDNQEKLNHKLISEYRMLNAKNEYVRLIEQYQILELDQKGQIWLMMNIVDVSPNQDEFEGAKSQLLNYRSGKITNLEDIPKAQIELTPREIEILKYVKEGLLSKEISDKLSISVHTVNTHRQRYLEKLGANNSLEAIVFASKYGLVN